MDILKKINYILNFDETKLFNTELDDKYTNKDLYIKDIQNAKNTFKEYLEKGNRKTDTSRAFDFCGLYLTDTPHQALAEYIVKALDPRHVELLWFLNHVESELRKVENEKIKSKNNKI